MKFSHQIPMLEACLLVGGTDLIIDWYNLQDVGSGWEKQATVHYPGFLFLLHSWLAMTERGPTMTPSYP